MAVRAALWDLDGTLTDSHQHVIDTANLVISRHGGTPLDAAVLAGLAGMPLEAVFRAVWPELSDADAAAYRDEYRRHYDEHVIPITRLYRGALTTLRAFRRAGLRQATVTGKRAADCERILRGLRLRSEIDVYLGGDSVARPKPSPDLALAAIARLGVRPEETVVIGDSRADMAMGRAAGARTIQVLWGIETDRVPEADAVARTWPELRAIVLGRASGGAPILGGGGALRS